jgi:hypothetical protein
MTTLFLDLEKTIIYSWYDPVIINEDRITRIIRSIKPDKIGIYSFAIYNNDDLELFYKTIQPEIETTFHIKIESDLTYTVEEMVETILQRNDTDIRKFIQEYGKQKSFSEFIKRKYKEGHFVLLDDLVDNTETLVGNLSIQFINPFLKVRT